MAHVGLVRSCGFEPVVIALEDEHSAADRGRFGDTEVILCPISGPRMIGYAPGMVGRMRAAGLDLVHLHGIWMYPSSASAEWAASTGRPYVISPHGMLDPWIVGRGVAKKAIAKIAYERRSWRRASLFHALTGAEARDVAKVTGRGETVVIPNAVTPAVPGPAPRAAHLLSLGRIHPKKNFEALIDGWEAAAEALRPLGAKFVLAGWGDDEHVAQLRARIDRYQGDDVSFVGPLFGEAKHKALTEARFLVLPSHSEGLPMAILEAWAVGTPTLMSSNCNLPEGFTRGAAIDCGTDRESIAAALRQAFALDIPKWDRMSQAAIALASGHFSPETVAASWGEAYRGMLDRQAGQRMTA